MLNLLTVLVGLAATTLIAVLATVTNSSLALPSAAVFVTVYASAHRDLFGALLTALVLGVVAGASMGIAHGVFLLALLMVVLVTRWARPRFPLRRRLVLLAWVAAAKVVADIGVFLLGLLLLPGLALGPALLRVTPLAALLTALAAWPFFVLLDRVEPLLRARQERSSLFGA